MVRLPEPLPRTLVPLPGEGLPGLLPRLAHRLDLSPNMVLARGGILTSRRPCTGGQYLLDLGEHLSTFAHAMRLTTEEAGRLTFAPDADRYPPITASIHARTRRNYLYDAWVFTKFTRYCPYCLLGNGSAIQQRHGGPWKIRWRLPISFLCLEHGRFLHDTCPGCQRPVHSSDHAGSRFLPMPAYSGLHPAQCRNQRPGITSDRLLCGTRIDDEVAQPPRPGVTPPLRRLQKQINDLLSPCADPTQASRYFTALRVMAAVLQATWPLGSDLAPAGLSDALDLHVDQLWQRQGTRGDHAERVRWNALPPSAVASATLLAGADTLLTMNTTARRDALRTMLPSAPAKGSKQWGRTWTHLRQHASPHLRDEVETAVANYL
ncbi:TniQ family protein [Streptomyces sp. NPDC059467]|uniref:TniQ family protein n=1 Tax=Streptomyces sp. NPDC059467 TaxID=3346844 RepID=UPI003676EA1B